MAHRRWPRMRSAVAVALAAALTAGLAVATGAYSGWPGSSGDDRGRAAPDLVLYNGKISTVDEDGSTVSAVAIRDGTIVATGRNGRVRALAKRSTEVVNLRGRRVLPGLIDGHLHGLRNGYHCFTQAVRLDNTTSRSAALAAYAAKADELADGRWILTTAGWTVQQLDQPGMLTLAELDAAAPENPVWVQAFGFMGVQVNSRALEDAGLEAGDPGVVLEGGQPTGQLTGPALAQAGAKVVEQLDAHSIDEQAECLADFVHTVNGLGLTAWKDPEGNQQPFNPAGSCSEFGVGLHGHQPVLELWRRNRLDVRIAFHLMNDFKGLEGVLADTRNPIGFIGDDRLRYLGVGEEVLCPGNEPPPDAAEYLEISRHLARNRLSFENHASASETQMAILDAWEQANEIYPIADLHWSIAHPGEDNVGPTAETLERAERLGIGMTPSDGGALGRGTNPPFRRILESGVRLCLASDAMNVAPFTPFTRLWYAISGQTLDPAVPGVPADQRLSRSEALRASTANCGWNLDQEGRVGSIEPGNHADLIVLNDDYFRVPTEEIRNLRSLLTVVGGRVVSADGDFARLDD
jgi:predicted amidohydrolase YtcJ